MAFVARNCDVFYWFCAQTNGEREGCSYGYGHAHVIIPCFDVVSVGDGVLPVDEQYPYGGTPAKNADERYGSSAVLPR